jgi:phage baseplate assembly protein gpV
MGAFVCSVEVDKTGGITVTVTNADGKIEQTLVMNGVSVELTVKGDSATSTIIQTADKVLVRCKQFEVEASETIHLKSTKPCTLSSGDTLTIEAAKAISVTSGSKIAVSAKESLVASGQMGVSLSSPQKVVLSSQAKLSFEGAVIEGKAQGMLNLESSGLATLKGNLTNVQGALVNLG